jgi:hypothetical protein
MLKEDKKSNLEKNKMKRKAINAEFLPWEPAEFHKQIEEYFIVVRKLSSMGLNLKLGITNEHVIVIDIKKTNWARLFKFEDHEP